MEFVREFAAVLVVLGILGVSLYWLRHEQARRLPTSGPLRAVAKVRLSENLVLHLIECAGVRCLITEQKASCSVLQLHGAAGEQERC